MEISAAIQASTGFDELRQTLLSSNIQRNKYYAAFLNSIHQKNVTVANIARFGYRCMRTEGLHPHFFGKHSLFEQAIYLSFFSLKFPYQFNNPVYLNKKITYSEARSIIELFEKRISERLPVEYITHEAFYLENKFYVNENVLVPRSLMNTRFKDFLQRVEWQNYKVLDLCTGSGCIGITLALMHPDITVDLSDVSDSALEVAQKNIDKYGLNGRVSCVKGDLFEGITDKYDLIISNPPYVPEGEYLEQPKEVKNEPSIALIAGKDGLALTYRILKQAKYHLNSKGTLIIEVGYTAAKIIKRNYRNVPFLWYKYRNPSGKKSILDYLIQWSGYLDSICVCRAKDLI